MLFNLWKMNLKILKLIKKDSAEFHYQTLQTISFASIC